MFPLRLRERSHSLLREESENSGTSWFPHSGALSCWGKPELPTAEKIRIPHETPPTKALSTESAPRVQTGCLLRPKVMILATAGGCQGSRAGAETWATRSLPCSRKVSP